MAAAATPCAPWRSTPTARAPASCRRQSETVRPRWRSADCDLFRKQALGPQFVDRVISVDDTHRARRRAQYHRLRVGVDVLVPDALQQLAGGDPCRCEENVLARAEVVEAEHAVGLVAFADGDLLFILVAKAELGLHVAADRLDRARREH